MYEKRPLPKQPSTWSTSSEMTKRKEELRDGKDTNPKITSTKSDYTTENLLVPSKHNPDPLERPESGIIVSEGKLNGNNTGILIDPGSDISYVDVSYFENTIFQLFYCFKEPPWKIAVAQ